ncbi:hypothetical protein FB451DRAFT_1536056 [Mycena latifolia]|nr:hypothetical protein FB451DRAFT_1536056 [Mycena latifolia]
MALQVMCGIQHVACVLASPSLPLFEMHNQRSRKKEASRVSPDVRARDIPIRVVGEIRIEDQPVVRADTRHSTDAEPAAMCKAARAAWCPTRYALSPALCPIEHAVPPTQPAPRSSPAIWMRDPPPTSYACPNGTTIATPCCFTAPGAGSPRLRPSPCIHQASPASIACTPAPRSSAPAFISLRTRARDSDKPHHGGTSQRGHGRAWWQAGAGSSMWGSGHRLVLPRAALPAGDIIRPWRTRVRAYGGKAAAYVRGEEGRESSGAMGPGAQITPALSGVAQIEKASMRKEPARMKKEQRKLPRAGDVAFGGTIITLMRRRRCRDAGRRSMGSGRKRWQEAKRSKTTHHRAFHGHCVGSGHVRRPWLLCASGEDGKRKERRMGTREGHGAG